MSHSRTCSFLQSLDYLNACVNSVPRKLTDSVNVQGGLYCPTPSGDVKNEHQLSKHETQRGWGLEFLSMRQSKSVDDPRPTQCRG